VRKIIVIATIASVLLIGAPAFAANAHTAGSTGQPSQSCEDQPSAPAGFNTSGFQNVADAHYAGNGAPSLNGNTLTAISQYDVACFQVSQH
jgi:hypothetical protein